MTLPPVPALHPDFSYRIDFVGRERQPVLVIDNFLNNAEGLVAYCEQLAAFASADGMYPGIRFPAPGLYVDAMYQHLGQLITSVFGLPDPDQMRVQSDFSLVVTPPAELQPRQRIPHYDSAKPHDLASVHYLCSEEKGGTSLYRHIATDFERIDLARVAEYKAIIAEQEKLTGFPNQYMNGSNELFEQIATYDAVFNRMLIYRCTSLHSGNIAPDLLLDPNPRTGRLTLNTFILSQS